MKMNELVSAVVVLVFLTIFGCILSTLAGGISAWIVGLFFEDTILGVFATLGIKGLSMFQIGAFLGFVAGFFKSCVNYKSVN